jgi:hypothetical protein
MNRRQEHKLFIKQTGAEVMPLRIILKIPKAELWFNCCPILPSFFFCLRVYTEDRGDTSVRNVSEVVPNYKA